MLLHHPSCSFKLLQINLRELSTVQLLGWIMIISGSAGYFFFSQSIQRQTRVWKRTNVPMFLCLRSTKVTGDHVIFYIFCIFCLLPYCTYSAYSAFNSVWLLRSLVGCMPVHHCIWMQCISTRIVCYSSISHTRRVTRAASSCSCGQFRENTKW